MAKKLTPGLRTPRTIDSYTGEEIKYVKAGSFWIASTSLWTSRPFHFKHDAEYAVSHTLGVAPAYPKPGLEVTRNEGERPRGAFEE